MKHLFIPYELALKLRDKGFDEPCIAIDLEDGKYMTSGGVVMFNKEHAYYQRTAITYEQVFRWFREKHNLRSFVDQFARDVDSPNEWVYTYTLKRGDGLNIQPIFGGDFLSYEEAQNSLINRMLTFI